VRHLNGGLLPRRYRAMPQVHLGPFVETDVATYDEEPLAGVAHIGVGESGNGGSPSAWSAPEAVQTLEIELPAQDVFEIRVFDDRRGMSLVATVELVSPGNKDRPESRQAFVTKCAAYLQDQVNVVVVDIVGSRRANLHRELVALLGKPNQHADDGALYSVAYRNRKDHSKWRLDFIPYRLALGGVLPTVPLWLASDREIPLDLEKSYEETCQVLRIGAG